MKEPKKNMGSKLRILWAGSTSHTGDLLMVEPVMKRILDEYKDEVEFVYVGHGGNKSKDLYTEFIYGEDLFKRLPQNRESILPVPPFIWSYVLASLGADIAIAPLEKNYFNKFKSQCKYLEYAINGIPGVYSAHHYTDVKDYYTGITADSMEDFYLSIKYLIDNPQMREAIGKQAREDVINNFNLESHLSEWRDFIYDISGIKNPN
jgi:glycosyltransferase involved in cell wall biosynthesis